MDNVPPPQPPYGQPPNTPPPGQPPYTQPPGGQYPGYPGQPPKKSNTGRNCLFGCLGLAVLLALFAGGIFFFVFNVVKSSDVYKTAVERAKSNPQVVEALGAPVKEGWKLSGSIHTTGDTGDAELNVPVSGSKDKGTVFVKADKSGGVWRYSKMYVHVDGSGQDIDINEPTP